MFLISSIFIGHKEERFDLTNTIEDDLTNVFDIVDIETKRKNQKTGKAIVTRFLKERGSSQMIKIPNSISLSQQDCYYNGTEIVDDDSNVPIITNSVKFKSTIQDGTNESDADLILLLNGHTLSPYLAKKGKLLKEKEYHYVYIVIDTTSCKLIKCEDGGKIISTFRQPQKNLLGCLLELSSDDNEVCLYLKEDEGKFVFKKVSISIDDQTKNLVVAKTSRLSKEELHEVRVLWGKKQKTRTFQYTYHVLPTTKITYNKSDSTEDAIEIKTREEAGNDQAYIKEIEKSLINAVGFIPKSILLEGDVTDLSYDDMISLHFNYVLAVKDGGIVTLKSN